MWLIVVRRDRPFVYETLREAFAHDPEYTVIRDRRRAERRLLPHPPLVERRRADRRSRRTDWSPLGYLVTRSRGGVR